MEEIWKDVPGYEGLYMISNMGQVKSLKFKNSDREKIMSSAGEKLRYISVQLYKNRIMRKFLVHRLVGLAFIENMENKKFINHIDGNGKNNKAENLEWCTSAENAKHRAFVLRFTATNFKVSVNKERAIAFNGKVFFGVISQHLIYTLLRDGGFIESPNDPIDRRRFTYMIYFCKTIHGLPIESKWKPGRRKIFFFSKETIIKIKEQNPHISDAIEYRLKVSEPELEALRVKEVSLQ